MQTPGAVYPDHYDAQLAEKVQRLGALMAPFGAPTPEVFSSNPSHYRMRAEFRVWHQGDDLFYIMFDQESRERIRVDSYPMGSALINTLMPVVIDLLKPNTLLRKKLFQVEFLTSQSGEAVVSLLYHKPLTDEWEVEARQLRDKLQHYGRIDLIGRAKKQKKVLDRDFVVEKLQVKGRSWTFQQVENSFTQPNAGINEKMLTWALDCTADIGGDLLELYCGNGNFTLPLSTQFDKVLATEIATSSVASAQYNMRANGISNVTVARLAAEEFTEAMEGKREFRRLKGVDLKAFHCRTIVVDPPRAGLDPATEQLVAGYQYILYISCNPETLAKNLETLTQTHRVEKLALFDQFPYSHHMESGVWLVKK
ncbi:tRNA (uridine(54)-C5)-methyltransferase TrmA [Gallaecimonas xiamenensis]|uniref:tRNA/tmRNA (uracil-C(5))-methyltransferase n=1 Tax=Gallaecimonas xiamenensis 3-C-1 TaxID=745411 RepID=K2JQN2_9GAMM|nr:tRNA (uridine(54)-C5)-methyltransferase TrmA [Gallaecimonas xiamenensis]EKE77598.1 tRNA (uracil-5-)-methyltransferase [Gallaecimonas xiamenensis 3-C-1]